MQSFVIFRIQMAIHMHKPPNRIKGLPILFHATNQSSRLRRAGDGSPGRSPAGTLKVLSGTDYKVLQNLTRAGLVVSRRGNTGGFELEEGHRTASLLEVVEAIEGPIRLNLCLTSEHGCNRQGWCPAHNVWAEAQRAVVDVLGQSKINDLAKRAPVAEPKLVMLDRPTWN